MLCLCCGFFKPCRAILSTLIHMWIFIHLAYKFLIAFLLLTNRFFTAIHRYHSPYSLAFLCCRKLKFNQLWGFNFFFLFVSYALRAEMRVGCMLDGISFALYRKIYKFMKTKKKCLSLRLAMNHWTSLALLWIMSSLLNSLFFSPNGIWNKPCLDNNWVFLNLMKNWAGKMKFERKKKV